MQSVTSGFFKSSLILILLFLDIFFSGCGLSNFSFAAEVDSASKEALTKTIELLQDRKNRNAAISKDRRAIEVDQRVHALAGSKENADELYSISGAVLEELVLRTGGDSKKMLEIVEMAKKDPAAFADSLSPEVRKKITDYSKTIPASKSASGHESEKPAAPSSPMK